MQTVAVQWSKRHGTLFTIRFSFGLSNQIYSEKKLHSFDIFKVSQFLQKKIQRIGEMSWAVLAEKCRNYSMYPSLLGRIQ